jgi:hypothetical protein
LFRFPPVAAAKSGQLMCYQNRTTPKATDTPTGARPQSDGAGMRPGGRAKGAFGTGIAYIRGSTIPDRWSQIR